MKNPEFFTVFRFNICLFIKKLWGFKGYLICNGKNIFKQEAFDKIKPTIKTKKETFYNL